MLILPDEILFSLDNTIPCRALYIRQLTALLISSNLPAVIVHGSRASGKSLTVHSVLQASDQPSAIVRSQECITTRHLLERTIFSIREVLKNCDQVDIDEGVDVRCESISVFTVELQRLLEGRDKFILVFDGIDRQRDAAPTLLPAVVRLGEIVSRSRDMTATKTNISRFTT